MYLPRGPSTTTLLSPSLGRYYVNDTFYKPPADGEPAAPLIFIPGGEWSVTPTKGILYGMAHDLAREHNGLMAIVEHRFYGGSLPFGPVESFAARPDRIGLLTIEQAMADYAAVIQSIQKEHGMVGAPVVSLGGSYSGKLSAYSKCRNRGGRVWFVCVWILTPNGSVTNSAS